MQELERWLDEVNNARWTNSPEEGELLRPVAEHYIRQLASVPEQAMPMLLHAIETSEKDRITTAFEVVRVIGYPQNTAAIPYLFSFLSDANFPGGGDVIGALREIDAEVLLPYITRILLKQAPPFSYNQNEKDWEDLVKGCCYYLRDHADQHLVQRCLPAVNFYLSYTLVRQPEKYSGTLYLIVDIIEKMGCPEDFLPALVLLAKEQGDNKIGQHAQRLLLSFTDEQLAPYRFLLASPSASEEDEGEK